MPVLIVAPMASEHSTVAAALAGPLRPAGGQLRLAMCGIGPARSRALAGQLEASGWRGLLALVGWAGGLDPALRPGDVVVADAAIDETGCRAPCMPVVLEGIAATVGPMLTVSRALATPDEKSRPGACAVEMEAYPLAEWAARQGIPFIHARVILDAAGEPLPGLGNVLDGYGRVRTIPLLARLARQPGLLPPLVGLGRRLAALNPALAGLARAVAAAALQQESA